MLQVLSQFLKKLIQKFDKCVYVLHVPTMSHFIEMYRRICQFLVNLYQLYDYLRMNPMRAKVETWYHTLVQSSGRQGWPRGGRLPPIQWEARSWLPGVGMVMLCAHEYIYQIYLSSFGSVTYLTKKYPGTLFTYFGRQYRVLNDGQTCVM